MTTVRGHRVFGKVVIVLSLLATSFLFAPSAGAQQAALYDETVDGEISNDAANALALTLGAGSNLVNGSVVAGDIDYVTITVPDGHELSALRLADYESANEVSFIGVQEGTQFTELPTSPDVANLLGFFLFGTDSLGTDILPAIGSAGGAQGFTGALPAGDYTFWIQETSSATSMYSFDFVVAPIADDDPPPAPLLCNDLEVTVNLANGDEPTEGDDVIRGTAGDDIIDGLGGNDTICALQGNDDVTGGAGFDKVFAGAGNDTLDGGAGNDLLVGGDGIDTIEGNVGNDRIQGGAGADILSGGGGSDIIRGGNGNDTIDGGTHADELFGNLGRDDLMGGDGNDILRGGAWLDSMDGGNGNNDACTLTDPSGNAEVRISCERGVFGI